MAYGTFPLLPLALLLSLSPSSAFAATSSLPKIDFNALGTVGVVGGFAGLQLYDPASPPTVYSSTASTLVSRSASGELNSAGATNTGGRISALCQTPSGAVFVGGLFTSLGGAPATNIAQYDPTTKAFTALGAGLDGEVLAMACNGTTVYAGGEFAAPVGAAAGAYAGHVAQWSTASSSWSPPVFAGLNGPVESITPSEDGKSLFFGGSFSTVFSNASSTSTSSSSPDDTTFKSLGSSLVPISLNGSDYVASPTTYTSGFGNPQYVFCPRRGDGIGASWLLVDGTIGSFITRLYRPLQVRGIRLGNTFFEGRGTSNFSLTSIPDNTVLTLTYASDPTDATSTTTTCQANCPLAHDPAVPYQDFLFPENHTMTGFELNILGFYGASAGLHLLQLLSEGSYAHAVDSYNYSPCVAGLGATGQSGVKTTGNWTQGNAVSSIPGTVQAVLTGQVPGGTSVADAPTLTWTPYVVSDGQYSIYYDTPGCQPANTCGKRTSVSVVLSPAGVAPTTTVIDQTNLLDKSTLIYTGTLIASNSANGGLEITVGLAAGGPAVTSVTYGIVANIVSLVAASTNGSSVAQIDRGYGLFEYPVDGAGTFGDAVSAASSLNAASSTLTNATAIDQLSFGLAAGSVVNAIASAGAGTAAKVFLGGNFVYTSGTSTSTNVVAYSGTAAVLAPNGGLAGAVTSLVVLDGVLYAAGAFVATSDGSVKGLDGAAMWAYETAGSVWQSLRTVPAIGGTITALGIANTGTDASVVAAGAGLAIFNPATMDWNSTEAGLVVGNLTAFGGATSSSNKTGTTYFAGNILAAMSFAAPGGALLSTNGDRSPKLTSLGYQLEPALSSSSFPPSVANTTAPARSRRLMARSMVKDVLGLLSSRSTLEPRAPSMMNATLPSALPSDSTAQVLAGAFWKNGSDSLMVLGGRFVASGGIANVGLYDQEARTLEALPGTVISGAVSVLAVFKDTLWIGGNFSSAAGRQGLSTYDLSKLAANDSSPALQGYTGGNATVNVIRQRPGFDSTIIVAGSFGEAGSLTCQSICAWDTTTRQWSSFGGGLQGVVGAVDFAGSKSEHLVAAGAFTLAGETAYVAQWNFKNQTWATLGSPADVPGPATALSTDSNNESKIWLAGTSTTDVPYLLFWNGTTWADVNDGVLVSGSGVQQLVFVPLSTNHRAEALIEKDRMLLVSGDLTINSTSISSALFDGETWYPYLVSSTATGSAGVISQLFYSITNFSLSKDYLSVGIVILISIAIALGLVFLLVIIGLLIALSRRNDEPAYPVQPRDDTDSLHAQHRPTSLLATVGAATAVLLDGKGEKGTKGGREPTDHDSVAGPLSFDGGLSYDEHHYDEDSAARVRYSFTAEQDAELTVSAGEDLTILESNDANWWLVSNSKGVRGLIPASYLA